MYEVLVIIFSLCLLVHIYTDCKEQLLYDKVSTILMTVGIIYAYYFGFAKALVCGFIYGILQFVQDPYILTPATFTLDYLLAFASISIMGLFSKRKLNAITVSLGTTASILTRFVMHFISGILYFNHGSIWVNLPAENAITYSLLYQVVYLIPDLIICLTAMLILYKMRVIEKIKPKNLTA